MIATARDLVAQSGAEALTMQAVAQAVGVRGPSLYKRFPDRDQLLDAVSQAVLRELAAKLSAAQQPGQPALSVASIARAYRRFAKRSPHLYALLFQPGQPREQSDELKAARAAAVAPLFEDLRALLREDELLPAARMLTAFLHGFVSMETSGAFRLGGDVQQAFDYGLERLLATLQAQAPAPKG